MRSMEWNSSCQSVTHRLLHRTRHQGSGVAGTTVTNASRIGRQYFIESEGSAMKHTETVASGDGTGESAELVQCLARTGFSSQEVGSRGPVGERSGSIDGFRRRCTHEMAWMSESRQFSPVVPTSRPSEAPREGQNFQECAHSPIEVH